MIRVCDDRWRSGRNGCAVRVWAWLEWGAASAYLLIVELSERGLGA